MVFFKNFEPCKKRDRKATERSILLAASKLFAEKGYENTRTLEIAKESGANEALITRYFGGKEGLLAAIIKSEEALQIVLSKKHADGISRFETFTPYSETKSLKKGIQLFFEDGLKSIEVKEEFMRIGSSRCLVDPEMAEAIKRNILDHHQPIIIEGLKTYPELKGKSTAELNALSLLIMSTHFYMNFQSRKIYKIDAAQVDKALKIFAEGIAAQYEK
jgi:AcrR family transcriptional regulator